MLPKEWTGDLVGLMHTHRITGKMLADKLGMTDRYVSMVLNGHREPVGIENRFRSALDELILEQDYDSTQSVQ